MPKKFVLISILIAVSVISVLTTITAKLQNYDLNTENFVFTFSNNAPIAISDNTIATPYPAEINVSGVRGTIQKLTVTLNDFQHTYPDDVDVLLVGPNGQSTVLMSDVGGGVNLTGISITLDDSANGFLPDSVTFQSGVYKPTDFEANDNFPPPAPASPHSSTLAVFNGTDANGAWRLFVVDDTGQDAGFLVSGWSLTVDNGVTGQNLNTVNIPDSGVASLYPSNIKVSGQLGTVVGVKVLLHGLSHNLPDDIDLLLVSPNGRSVVLMSDAGGSAAVSNLSLTFDDSAANSLPDNSPIVSGSYKPTNIGTGDSFPYPAPANAPSGTALSVFNGSNPNGSWGLYLVDDTSGNAGSLTGGWSLAVSTSTTACPLIISPESATFERNGGTGNFGISSPAGCEWSVSVPESYDFVTVNSSTGGEGSGAVSFTVNANDGGARTGFIEAANNSVTRTFRVQQGSGCPFALGQTSQSFSHRGGLGSVSVSAAAACLWQVTSDAGWLTVESPAGGVNGNSIVTFKVAPNGTNLPRTGNITIGARRLTVTQAAGTGCPYSLNRESDYFRTTGGTGSVGVLAAGTCAWTAGSNVGWITINSGTGSGNGNVTFTVAPNPANSSRTGTITVGDETFTILQGRNGIPTPFDFDGDGRGDLSVFRPSNGIWYIVRSSNNTTLSVQFGLGTDRLVPADYDGDRKTDIAVFRNGAWFILNSSDNTFRAVSWGTRGDAAAPGDFDGDGKADTAVWRPSQATWYVLQSSNNGIVTQPLGNSSDTPVPADYDGDGKTDFVNFRAGERADSPVIWFLRYSSNNQTVIQQFGSGEDVPVPADYDGDGRINMAVFRPSLGIWFRSTDPARSFDLQAWGLEDDSLVAADYDGDGKADVAVFREGNWFILKTSDNQAQVSQWGANGDLPVPSNVKPPASQP